MAGPSAIRRDATATTAMTTPRTTFGHRPTLSRAASFTMGRRERQPTRYVPRRDGDLFARAVKPTDLYGFELKKFVNEGTPQSELVHQQLMKPAPPPPRAAFAASPPGSPLMPMTPTTTLAHSDLHGSHVPHRPWSATTVSSRSPRAPRLSEATIRCSEHPLRWKAVRAGVEATPRSSSSVSRTTVISTPTRPSGRGTIGRAHSLPPCYSPPARSPLRSPRSPRSPHPPQSPRSPRSPLQSESRRSPHAQSPRSPPRLLCFSPRSSLGSAHTPEPLS
jgi:hypothetical protein